MTSIFRLEEVRAYENDEQLYRDAIIGILGHYSSLGNALDAIHQNNIGAYEPDDIYAYLIKEVAVDGEIGESDCLSIRSYDAKGNQVDECLQNYNLVNQYEGREPDIIRFRVGDIVEVLEGHQYLYNFATLPSKSICRRCHLKWLADYSGDLINGEVWKEVDAFEGDARSDEELIKMWGGH